ncbi:DNA glycosylase, partial [Sphaerulina musiva SO2202]
PCPPLDSPLFGIIQERTCHEPFWLIIATVFLNKTTGRQAAPTFWKIREKWNTPAQLAEADYDELFHMIKHLGFQHQRTKRLKLLAAAWEKDPPRKGRRFRTLHYPSKGDGKHFKSGQVIEGDVEDCAGALEIAHLPGCGAYAYDSWRIFCRDVLRGVEGEGEGKGEVFSFEPEWKRVLPQDKELRACLRWMWLKEGWIWDPVTGAKRRATPEEIEKANKG